LAELLTVGHRNHEQIADRRALESNHGECAAVGRDIEAPIAVALCGLADAAALLRRQIQLINGERLTLFAIANQQRLSVGHPGNHVPGLGDSALRAADQRRYKDSEFGAGFLKTRREAFGAAAEGDLFAVG